jgi:hypothetical protein
VGRASAIWLFVLIALVCGGGASCPKVVQPFAAAPQPVVGPAPSLEELARVVNDNSTKIRAVSTVDAKISVPGHALLPSVKASMAWERGRHFRLTGGTAFTGPEVDLGSNDQLFWIWMRQSAQPSILYCHHQDFPNTELARVFPVDPEWLIDACGLPIVDPNRQHFGPYLLATAEGESPRYGLYTVLQTPRGPVTKTIVIDGVTGWVVQQSLIDPADSTGQPFALAVAEDFQRDALTGAFTPRKIKLQWPKQQFGLEIDLGTLRTNEAAAQDPTAWDMPEYEGAIPVNLADPRVRIAEIFPPAAPQEATAPSATTAHRTPFGLFDWLLPQD